MRSASVRSLPEQLVQPTVSAHLKALADHALPNLSSPQRLACYWIDVRAD
jgi:hypothetical protein